MKKEGSVYHFIGIGGIGMSSLARILLQRNIRVSGSDLSSSTLLKTLQEAGAHVFIGHKAEQVPDQGQVIYTTSVSHENNEEYREAEKKGLLLIHRSDLLCQLMQGFAPLLVAGTHGKTTTSSLLAHTLLVAGEDPSFSVGGIVPSLQGNGRAGQGAWFVAEADESDGSFLSYTPYGAILTNIDLDHMNYWKTEENLLQGFLAFYKKIKNPECLFWCADDPRLSSLSLKGVRYGFSDQADLKIEQVEPLGWKMRWSFSLDGKRYEDFEVPLIGRHNVLNASAVAGLALRIGLAEQEIRNAFLQFLGVQRRSEKKGEALQSQVLVYDDYGHHPVEIASTLQAMKRAFPGRRIIVVFQPHRFTRTQDCWSEFAPALQIADHVILTDIYPAGEKPMDQVDAKRLYKETFSQERSCYLSKDDLFSLEALVKFIQPHDVVVTMGAGDITQLGSQLLKRLS